VEDVLFVEGFQGVDHLNGQSPDFLLGDELLSFSVCVDEGAEIATFCKFGNHAERASDFFVEGFFVGDNVRIVDAGQNSNLIESVGDFTLIGVGDFDFFEGVKFGIFFSLDFVDGSESSFTDFGNDFELIHG
jgi:hypothetical protein